MRRTAVSLTSILVLFGFIAIASANVVEVAPGGKAVCENAAWIAYNLSETQDTKIEFDIGPYSYAWKKIFKATLAPGGYETNAIARRSIITNKGPGRISFNCQRERYDRHDWKMDAGKGNTYQSNYHLDHVKPSTYIEPGYGMPEGTERGIMGVTGEKPESQR